MPVLLPFCCARADTKLLVGAARGYPGLTVSVPIILATSSNTLPAVVALQADVLFAAGLLNAGPATPGTSFGNHILESSEPQPGVRRLLIYAPNNALLTNGVIANIPFSIPLGTRASTLPLSLTNVILATALANSTVSANVSGLIIINPVFVRPDRDVNLFFVVSPDRNYLVQASTTLTTWRTLSITSAPTSYLDFTDAEAHNFPFRFYRVNPAP